MYMHFQQTQFVSYSVPSSSVKHGKWQFLANDQATYILKLIGLNHINTSYHRSSVSPNCNSSQWGKTPLENKS